MGFYAEGYKLAGDKLVKYVNEQEQKQDYLVFPIVFLYRHSIELWLKHIIELGNELHDRAGRFPTNHQIEGLWSQARMVAEEVWKDAPRDELNQLEEYLSVLHNIDSGSFSFRYPVTKDGEATLSRISYVNLRHFSEVMEKVDALLRSISMGLAVYLDYKRDMVHEMEREYRGG